MDGGRVPTLDCALNYLDLFFMTFTLAFTSFFTNVIGTGLPIGKLTMAFVVA